MAEVLDARGLKCPLPVLKARRALKALPEGTPLEVLADDPAAPADFRAFSRTAGYSLQESALDGGGWRFLLAKPG